MKIKRTMALLLAVMMLTACAKTEENAPETEEPTSAPETEYQWETLTDESRGSDVTFDTGKLYANFDSVLRPFEKEAYRALIETIRAGKDRCVMEQETFEKVSGFAAYSPYYALVDTLTYTDGAASLVYLYDTETLTQRVADFDAKLRVLLYESGAASYDPSVTDERRALALYRFVASQCTYRFGENENLMTCVLAGSYTEVAFNVLYAQLLLQADIPVVLVSDADGHVWVAANLGGAWYHFDPAGEYFFSIGYGLRYFGMTDTRRVRDEITAPLSVLVPAFWIDYTEPVTPSSPSETDAESVSPEETGEETDTPADTEIPSPEESNDTAEPDLPERIPLYTFTLACTDSRYDAFDSCSNWAFDEDGVSLYLLPAHTSFALRCD